VTGFVSKREAAADKLQEPAQEQEEDWGALAEKQLASIKRDTRASFEDAVVRATHKVMAELEAQPVQEPLHIVQSNGQHSPLLTHMMNKRTAPPKREWVELTQKEVQEIHDTYHKRMGPQEFASMIGAKLKEKNNGT